MSYSDLSPQSRVWIYQSNRELSQEEVDKLRPQLARFAKEWVAHGKDLFAHADVYLNWFIVLFADETSNPASGCSIDTSVQFLKSLQDQYGFDLFDRMNLALKVDGKVQLVRYNDIAALVASEVIAGDSIMFNNLVKTKEEFEKEWETPLRKSWLAQQLPLPV